MSRILREKRTITAMVKIYCRFHHATRADICPACLELRNYAHARLDKCPYKDKKPTCQNCPIHCYSPNYKEQVKVVMAFSGPRIFLRHPLLAIFHLIDEFMDKLTSKAKSKKVKVKSLSGPK